MHIFLAKKSQLTLTNKKKTYHQKLSCNENVSNSTGEVLLQAPPLKKKKITWRQVKGKNCDLTLRLYILNNKPDVIY